MRSLEEQPTVVVSASDFAALREKAEFSERLVDASDDCIKVLDLDARLISMSPNGMKSLRIMDFATVEGACWIDFWNGDDRVAAQAAVEAAKAGGTGRFTGYFPVENEPRWFDVVVTPISDAHGRPEKLLAVSRDVTEQHQLYAERARVEDGLRLLSSTGAATLNSLDSAATLRNIVRTVVAEFATICVIDVLEDGRWKRVAVAHRSTENERVLRRTRHLSQPIDEHPVSLALREGRSSVVIADAAWVRRVEHAPDRIAAAEMLGIRSLITVPVTMPAGAIVGAMTCVRDATDARGDFGEGDLAFVEEVGRRAGAAIANAQLYERERRIAMMLQSASLPATLPRVAGLELDAEYRPGSDEATIGGDWYDAFVLDDGRVALTVGDVLGHGLRAAVTMTKLRQAMQSAAMVEPDPNVMLDVADKTLRLLDPDGYATAVAAIYDRNTGTLTFASAGHPGLVVCAADGRVEEIVRPGIMLGLRSGRPRETTVVPAPPGTVVVFHTDGLTEATRDMEEGQRRLHAALAGNDAVRGPRPAEAIVRAVLGTEEAGDDVAVLVARIV
ncbi:MAG TPA: SpoIIE family protein phosphatase [Candidatus Elarobacter sp.]|jgi:serine phosphatase RsbU (regulator of sigma subunit)|nr:SpoIIE family protein phosphatase [Candidatus Elarobacter sp.]